MNEQNQDLFAAGRDHNGPPELLPVLPLAPSTEALERVIAALPLTMETAYDAAIHATLNLTVLDFCDACGAWKDVGPITSQEQAARLTDFITQVRDLEKRVEDARINAKKPWDFKADQVQTAFKPLKEKLALVKTSMGDQMADFLKREKARVEAEQAEAERVARIAADEARRAAEAAAARNDVSGAVDAQAAIEQAEKAVKAAEKPVSAKIGSASGGGRAISLRTQAYADIENLNLVYMAFRDHDDVKAVLQKLADAAIRGGNEVPGAVRKTREVAA